MPQETDLYSLLGVPRTATQEEIRKAYLKLAHKYHPDKTGGDVEAETKLKGINAAYDILKNPEKRQQYDAFGTTQPGMSGGQGGFGGFRSAGGFDSPFDDFFDVLFGQGRRGKRRAARPGADLEYRVSITLREAAAGAKKKIRFNRLEICPECSGTGATRGTQAATCSECQGSGQVRRAQGFFSVTQTCPSCRGAGQTIADPCKKCSGGARVRVERELKIDLPAGIDTGQRLRVAGEGEPGDAGGPRGDLYILVEVMADDVFRREGNDVVCEVPIRFTQAILGDNIRVPTLTGEAELKIPAGTQGATRLRLREMGFPDLQGYRKGDQIVIVQVEIPAKISKEQRDLIVQFDELTTEKSYPFYKRFVDRIKRSVGGGQ